MEKNQKYALITEVPAKLEWNPLNYWQKMGIILL
jgi:hypothetical protein